MSAFPVRGVRAGHWTGRNTGVTVLLAPSSSVGAAEVRGGAPATRELSLLDPPRTVARVDAVVLTGGSAFGLATADGVMRFLAERGQGYPTSGGPVPIVPTAAVFDLDVAGDERPGAAEGHAAAVAAERGDPLDTGRVGAGRGATVGKWRGRGFAAPGGLGLAATTIGGDSVAALAVVNAIGDVIGAGGEVIAGSGAPAGATPFPEAAPFGRAAAVSAEGAPTPGENTTLVVVATDAALDPVCCRLLAESAHDGLARALRPAHTRFDGDLVIVVATGTEPDAVPAGGAGPGHLDRLREGAAGMAAAAIRSAVA